MSILKTELEQKESLPSTTYTKQQCWSNIEYPNWASMVTNCQGKEFAATFQADNFSRLLYGEQIHW